MVKGMAQHRAQSPVTKEPLGSEEVPSPLAFLGIPRNTVTVELLLCPPPGRRGQDRAAARRGLSLGSPALSTKDVRPQRRDLNGGGEKTPRCFPTWPTLQMPCRLSLTL